MHNQNNINYLKALVKNVYTPQNSKLKKIYNKSTDKTSFKLTHPVLTRSQVRASRKEAIHSAKILRKKLGLKPVNRNVNVINLTGEDKVINLTRLL